jgi:hypothetical protein
VNFTVSYPLGTAGFVPGGKAAGCAVSKLRMSGDIRPLSYIFWCGAEAKVQRSSRTKWRSPLCTYISNIVEVIHYSDYYLVTSCSFSIRFRCNVY